MLADCTIVTAKDVQNEDLLWAICSGVGGNLGVLLTWKFQPHDLGDRFGFAINWALETSTEVEQAANALAFLQNPTC